MTLQVESEFDCNSIILISSTKDTELGNTRRLNEDISVIASSNEFSYFHYEVNEKHQLIYVLDNIHIFCEHQKLKPIIHLHMHGSEELGLELNPSSENMPWDELSFHFKKINTAMKNELCVISTACHAYKIIESVKIKDVTPFFFLIAAKEEVQMGYISDNIPPFYRSLFSEDSINDAYSNISNVFSFYHCEKVLAEALMIYIMDYCKGKAKQNRKEFLLSKVLSNIGSDLKIPLAEIRNEIKQLTKPEQNILESYVNNFLIGKSVNFSIEDLLESVESAYA